MEGKNATLNDLTRELWFRERNSGQIVWRTKNGDSVPIKDMSDSHLINAINLLSRNEEYNEIASEYEAYISNLD